MLLKKSRLWLARQSLRTIGLNCAISALSAARKLSAIINKRKITDAEIWVCYSTISYILAYCYVINLSDRKAKKASFHTSFLVLSRSICPPKVKEFLHASRNTKEAVFNPQDTTCNIILFFAIFSKLLKGDNIKLRLPHLYEPVVGKSILRLAKLAYISLEFYDDGLLGCLNNPTVKNYYPTSIANVCHWDSAYWKPPSNIALLSHSAIPLTQFKLYAEATKQSFTNYDNRVIVVEAKYMNYGLLNQIFSPSERFDASTEITYFQHPSVHKRNLDWPSKVPRTVVQNEQCETWLFRNLSSQSHIYSAVTSSVLLACELALQKMISMFKLSLLVEPRKSPEGLDSFYNKSEALDFIKCIVLTYSNVVDIEILDSDRICC